MKSYGIGLFALVLSASSVQAATLQVGPARTYTSLNAALAAAGSGDVIEMDEDVTFTECSVLPAKGNLASPITIRSSASNANLPGAGVRFDPGNATWAASVAILKACTGGAPAIGTANGAQDYVIGPGLKFLSNPGGFGSMISLGTNSASQHQRSHQPDSITVDRNWLSGDTIVGQKVGVDLNGSNLSVTNNYIDEIKAFGQDSIGVRCVNGDGPLTIENNFIAAAAENFLCGGDSPQMRTFAVVNSGATTTSATLSSLSNSHLISELKVGQMIAFLGGANTLRYHTYVRSCGTSTPGASCSSASITYDAIPAAPDTGTGSEARFGSIPNGITIRRNHFYKYPAWRSPIIGTTTMSAPTASNPAGATLAAGTYAYRVVALNKSSYNNNTAYGSGSTEVLCTVTANGQCALSWSAVTNATHYRVYRGTSPAAQTGYFEVATNSANDNGLALTTASIPSGTKWVVKNLFEIKYGTNYQIDSNVLENAWPGADNGQAVWLKSNEYGGVSAFAQTKNVVWEKNIIRNVDGCFNILGRNANGNTAPAPLENVIIRNSACYDSDSTWLDAGDATTYAFNVNEPIVGLTIENVTIIHKMRGAMYLIATSGAQTTGLVIRNSIFRAEGNGFFASGYTCTKGTSCLAAASPGYVFAGNVVCGASASGYPTGNTYPTCTEFEGSTHFTNYAGDDYSLKSGSTWKGTAVGGGDPGANWAVLTSATTGVTSGAAESTTPPNITTSATLSAVTQGNACSGFSSTLAVSGGTGPYTWTRMAGSFPTGCTVSSAGAWSGTAGTAGTGTFTMRATDSTSGTALWDEQVFTWTINPSSSTLAIVTSATLPPSEVSVPVSVPLQASGGTPPYTWDISSGSVPNYAALSPVGVYSGVPDLPTIAPVGEPTTSVSFTARVTDAVGATATRTFTQVVTRETMPCSRSRSPKLNNVSLEFAGFRRSTAPTSAAPDCAMKGDVWFDTVNLRLMVATSNSPLVWSSATTTVGDDPVGAVIVIDGPPNAGDLPIGTEDGRWRRTSAAGLTGLDASAIATGTIDAARLPPTGWAMVPFHLPGTASATWTDQPSAETELLATTSKRTNWDTRGMTQVQLHFRVQGASTSANSPRCYAKYSLDDSTFTAITGGDVSLSVAGTKAGAWATVPPAAQTETTVWSVFCIGGDGASDPAVGSVALQFK